MGSFSDIKELVQSLLASDSAGLWRVFIATLLTLHIAWACSWLPGIPGFALAKDVEDLQDNFNEFLKTDLEEKLFNMQERLCALRREIGTNEVQNADRELRYKERIRKLLKAHRQLFGFEYTLDECARL